jgi:hypothetical protein
MAAGVFLKQNLDKSVKESEIGTKASIVIIEKNVNNF